MADPSRTEALANARAEPAPGRLAENIVYFARALRAAGMPVGPGMVLDALAAVNAARLGTRADFYWTLHAVFVKRREHSILFDQAFRIFFRKRGYLERLIAMMMPQLPAPQTETPRPAAQRVEEALFSGLGDKNERDKRELEVDARLTVSDREVLQKKDFAQMTAAEIAAAKEAIARLVLPFDEARTRRLAPHRHGHIIDLRRTLRASLKAGGALIDLKYLGPRRKAPPVVALLDISGSMSQYTRLFLHFLHALRQGSRPRCICSTNTGRDACSPRAPSCSLSRTDWSAIPTMRSPSRSIACIAPAGGSFGSIRCSASRASRRRPKAS